MHFEASKAGSTSRTPLNKIDVELRENDTKKNKLVNGEVLLGQQHQEDYSTAYLELYRLVVSDMI